MRDTDTGIYMENETLGNFARNTARTLEPEGYIRGERCAAATLAVLRSLRRRLDTIPPGSRGEAVQWFSDNWYLAEREGKSAAADLRHAGRLPKCAGMSRALVSEAACALVRSGRGEVTGERVLLFLTEFQKSRPLTERELSVFVPALRAELCAFLEAVFPEPAGEEQALLLKNIFTSLRALSIIDMGDILERVNLTEAALRQDPSGVYPKMDEETRAAYRAELALLAREAGITEAEAANRVLKLSRESGGTHVGTYIFTRPLGKEKRISAGGWYMSLIILSTVFLSILTAVLTDFAPAFLLTLIPFSQLVKSAVDMAALRVVPPKRLPRMELPGGIPPRAKTVCVISALLTGEKDGPKFARLMEEYRLLNRDAGENLLFGILADLRESDTRRAREDGQILDAAKRAVDSLNKKYSGGFYLFYRERELNEADGIWMGRERKRGAIQELSALLSGKKSALKALSGDEKALAGAGFILTLDADTRLTAGAARELVGAALHPLNVPVIDEKLRRVVSGYGIFEPRVTVDLQSAGKSGFSRIFAGEGGLDPYSPVVSDLYQDLFSSGTFMGKGLINVPVYERLISGSFPDNTVLSHDILEGAYMRCAFVSDVEVTDGAPFKVTSYLARQERWTRGDWQNLGWCRGRVRDRSGALVKNTLSELDRWKLADNLRRSLAAPSVLIAVLAAMVWATPALTACALIALAGYLGGLIISAAGAFLRHDGSNRARYQSAVIAGLGGAITRSLVSLMLLPAEGWTQLRAAATAIYRMAVSRRGLLKWVTSSEAERRHGNTLAVNYRALLACPVAGLIALVAARGPLAAAVGIVWLFTPAYAWRLSREIRSETPIPQSDRAYLLSQAGAIWRYFADNMGPEDNYLPPDNVQVEPGLGAAHRTSPTNIGLALLSCAAASDLGIIGGREASERAVRILDTCEKLTKWKGHLLNWYDTRTLTPLEPRYVSTVDSGNLMGCLIAMRQWFLGRNDPDNAERCERLLADMDLRPLFDERRKLFRIGWDLSEDKPTQGWYDLLASEARQTGFIAVALGQVPKKHWRRLGRALVSQDNFSGMVSWTGTMFEYLMPNLLLPCPENSLIYESSKFCLYAQKRCARSIPWGISESAFYAFDPGLSYRYKAHGVQRLALKRGMDSERVVSPYSTFLALGLDPKGAVKNLKRLEGLGLSGKYGFYEAADFTPSRMSGQRPRIVRSFMSHHLGMSLVAVANALCGGVFPRRFMDDERMGAYRELLEERVPTGQIVLRQPPRDVPEKPRRQESAGVARSFDTVDALAPAANPLSNGRYSVLLWETGASRSVWGDLDVARFEPELTGRPGMALYLRAGEELIPLTPAPDFRRDVDYRVEFTDVYGKFRAKKGGVTGILTVTVPPSCAGEVRSVEVTAPTELDTAELICVLEPVLCRRAGYLAHPAFSALSLEAGMSDGVLTIRRRPKNGEAEVFLAAASDAPMAAVTHTRRGGALGTGELLRSCPDMRVTLTVEVKLTSGRGSASLALCCSGSAAEASSDARRCAGRRETQAVSRLAASALMLGMAESEVSAALELIPSLIYGGGENRRRRDILSAGDIPLKRLWSLGISGNTPIISARVESEEDVKEALALIRRHALLSENGVESELALILTDGGDYRASQRAAVTGELRRLGRENTLGSPGGVFLVDIKDPARPAAEGYANVEVHLGSVPAAPAHRERLPDEVHPYLRGAGQLNSRVEPDGTFRFAMTDVLPEAAWSHILANRDFGFIATECGTGHMWYKNSRLGKINPWLNDPNATVGCERLEIVIDGAPHSLFADGSGIPTLVEYGFGWAAWERDFGKIRSRLTAFVMPNRPVRILALELEGQLDGAWVRYHTDLILGETPAGAQAIVTKRDGDTFTFRTPSGYLQNVEFEAVVSPPPEHFTCRKRSAFRDDLDGFTGAGEYPSITWSEPASNTLVMALGQGGNRGVTGVLEGGNSPLNIVKNGWKELVGRVKTETPDRLIDNYVNGWAVYQTVACRLLARTGLYQNGGAMGFRDQLQDAMSLLMVEPKIALEQLKLAASRQYREGDVMHWWHDTPEGIMGVRTHCSDDLLWLPWALCDYVNRTGDTSVCFEKTPFLESEPLKPDDKDRYETPKISAETATILAHCELSLNQFLARGVGSHGLALMLGGDWNDGMDGVGRNGAGESVWLTLFGSIVLRKMAELCEKMGENSAEKYSRAASSLLRAAEGAWCGEWYLRGFFDDGTPLGAPAGYKDPRAGAKGASSGNDSKKFRKSGETAKNTENNAEKVETPECELDSISQSFAFFAGADRSRAATALESAYLRLFDQESRVCKLFDPPFDAGFTDPGYIRGYAPGFRENGGQYTHAAVWLAMALLESGQYERGAQILTSISPQGRDGSVYAVEPYVIAADVCSAPGLVGRGGWSWYTGSAGWYFRAVTESLLGLKMRDGRLFVEPNMPERLYPARVEYRAGGENLELRLYPEGTLLNGEPFPKDGYPLKDALLYRENEGISSIKI